MGSTGIALIMECWCSPSEYLLLVAGKPGVGKADSDPRRRSLNANWVPASGETAFADAFPFLLASEVILPFEKTFPQTTLLSPATDITGLCHAFFRQTVLSLPGTDIISLWHAYPTCNVSACHVPPDIASHGFFDGVLCVIKCTEMWKMRESAPICQFAICTRLQNHL